jgi:hypothetical protein
MATALPRLIDVVEVNLFRTWTDECHVASHHIPELRQLVKSASSQNSSRRRD